MGHLASVHDAAENKFVEDLVVAKIDAQSNGVVHAWIGLHLQGDYADRPSFKWQDSTELEFTNWATNEPNNVDGNEACGQIYSNGYWNDAVCTKETAARGFVCKRERPTEVRGYIKR